MNRYVLFIYLLFFVGTAFAQQDENFYFYSTEDISNIKSSSKTKWGNKILGKLAETIAEREKHSLAIPALEGGHGHHYFVRFITLNLYLTGKVLKRIIAQYVRRNGVMLTGMTGHG